MATEKIEAQILVVDDSRFARKGMVNILEEEGLNVVGEASNAEEAVNIAANNNCNIFIVDVVMPDASGLEVAKLIHEKFRDVAVILVSSLRLESIIIDAISTGAMDYIQKPFEKRTLVQSVKKVEQELNKNSMSG